MQNKLEIDGLNVEVRRKPIKHFYLRICQQQGHVLVSAPLRSSDRAIKQLVSSKASWLRAQIQKFQTLPSKPEPLFENGDLHYFLGQPYTLALREGKIPAKILLTGNIIELYAPLTASPQYRERALDKWYKQRFYELLPALIEHWQGIIPVRAKNWRLRKMKSRWGTCNTVAQRIWLNLDLIKKPLPCLEYVLVHELVHLIERGHNQRFYALMTQFLPDWQKRRKQLNSGPLPAAAPPPQLQQ